MKIIKYKEEKLPIIPSTSGWEKTVLLLGHSPVPNTSLAAHHSKARNLRDRVGEKQRWLCSHEAGDAGRL